jgi:steroid delta-isomerase-like uncharacterized protein
MSNGTIELLQKYYQAFNKGDIEEFLALLSDDVIHDINQGTTELGKSRFRQFLEHMNRCYKEHVSELTIMTSVDESRAAAEFRITGTYLQTDGKLPPAAEQKYSLPVGAFFTIYDGKITRVTNYYNLQDWLKQISQ